MLEPLIRTFEMRAVKMKNRMLCILLCCLFGVLFPVFGEAADSKDYTLGELGMTVSLPPDYAVFTRNMRKEEPVFAEFGISYDSWLEYMRESSMYLTGLSRGDSWEIAISMTDGMLENFSQMEDIALSVLGEFFTGSEYKNMGMSATDFELYHHSQAKFIKIYYSYLKLPEDIDAIQYHTVYAGKTINIMIFLNSLQLSPALEVELQGVIDSIIFDTPPPVNEHSVEVSNAFTFRDGTSNATFTVSANWVEKASRESSAPRISLKALFVSTDGAASFGYANNDLWNQVPESERVGFSKSDISNDLFTKEVVADMFGIPQEDIDLIRPGTNAFYNMAVETQRDSQGREMNVPHIQTMAFHNGFMHIFYFFGTVDSTYYEDYMAMLASVHFAQDH